MSTTDARARTLGPGSDEVPDGPVLDLMPGRRVPLSPRQNGPDTVVTRLLPQRHRRTVGAWCFVDHYGPDDVSGSAGMQVAPHPHTGLQTVSWLLEGLVRHRDTLGSDVVLHPGALGLMTAGRGIAHSERSPAERPALLHGVQLWVVLPEAARRGEPAFVLHDNDLPTLRHGGVSTRVFVGSLDGASSPALTHTPLLGAEVRLDAGASDMLPVEPDFEHALVVVEGVAAIDETPVERGTLAYLGSGRTGIDLASPTGGVALLLGGTPFTEELVMWWNFIGRSQAEIERFRLAWNESDEFGRVVGDDNGRLVAPPLPEVVLKPRGRTS
jgi:redox-sensitive bicupin YhaK (pirin superfamily)